MNLIFNIAKRKTDNVIQEIFTDSNFRGDVLFDEPMKGHTTLRIGGFADVLAVPRDAISVRNLISEARDKNIPVTPVGGGSNLLVADEGIGGVVVSTAFLNRMRVVEKLDDGIRLFVEAGSPLQKVVHFAKEKGYTGIEGLAGIPGFMGGAVKGNAGSFGYEIGTVIESVAIINPYGKLAILDPGYLDPGYRSSAIPDECIILSANIRLQKGDVHDVARRVKDFLREKRESQPLSEWSAGCVFKNPEDARAGRLIDEAGCKHLKRGDVEVSGLHANFFINRGSGRAADFLALMDVVKERVMKLFGYELEPEIKVVGRGGRCC
ncbi:MAG TPA: hypothetical protein DCP92_14460 [Nitrospiraceae bacterium]|jgi:UDP-N-acetylmuramate dehydrogenase|nr:hypothetical protein [Nitrospiraceae bacterium]